jgi:hypothetical protein
LIGGCVLLWLVVAVPAYLWFGEQHLLYSAVAAGVCLVPMAATLLWCEWSMGKSPELQLAAVLGGTGVRMVFVVGVGMLLYLLVPALGSAWFWIWILGFYLITLTIEVILVAQKAATSNHA